MLEAVLFDMDGVLFDSMPFHAVAWTQALADFGLQMTREEVYMNEGRTGSGTINALAQRTWGRDATEQEVHDIYERKAEIFTRIARPAPMPGAMELLQQVKDDDLKIVIVTGSGQHSLLDNLEHYYPGIFRQELMVTAFDVKRGKPDPEPYLMGLQKAGVDAAEAIVVENAPLGVRAAHAAGIYTIAVNTGPLPDSALLSEGADVLFPSMQALSDGWGCVGVEGLWGCSVIGF